MLVDFGDAVDHAGEAERIVGAAPLLAGERKSRRDGAIDVGEVVRFDVAIGEAGAREHAEFVR